MKKIAVFLALILSCSAAYAYNFDKFSDNIKIEQKVSFSMDKQEWTRGTQENNYNFTKYITIGSGGYSEYELKNIKYNTNTTFEFLNNKKLIGYNHHNLKFYNLSFNGKKFIDQPLATEQVQEFFPNTEIIKISDFENNKITVTKPLLKPKRFLLWNDTNKDYYKYSFENYKNDNTLFRALFTALYPKTFIYSHFGSRDEIAPPLYIKVKIKGLI